MSDETNTENVEINERIEALEAITKTMLVATIHDYDLSIVSLESQGMFESAKIVGEKREFMQDLLEYFDDDEILTQEDEIPPKEDEGPIAEERKRN